MNREIAPGPELQRAPTRSACVRLPMPSSSAVPELALNRISSLLLPCPLLSRSSWRIKYPERRQNYAPTQAQPSQSRGKGAICNVREVWLKARLSVEAAVCCHCCLGPVESLLLCCCLFVVCASVLSVFLSDSKQVGSKMTHVLYGRWGALIY